MPKPLSRNETKAVEILNEQSMLPFEFQEAIGLSVEKTQQLFSAMYEKGLIQVSLTGRLRTPNSPIDSVEELAGELQAAREQAMTLSQVLNVFMVMIEPFNQLRVNGLLMVKEPNGQTRSVMIGDKQLHTDTLHALGDAYRRLSSGGEQQPPVQTETGMDARVSEIEAGDADIPATELHD